MINEKILFLLLCSFIVSIYCCINIAIYEKNIFLKVILLFLCFLPVIGPITYFLMGYNVSYEKGFLNNYYAKGDYTRIWISMRDTLKSVDQDNEDEIKESHPKEVDKN